MRSPTLLLILAGLLSTACDRAAPAAATADPPSATTATAAPAEAKAVDTAPVAATSAKPAIDAAFAKDMPYATLRKHLLDAGWLPLRDPACWENAGGGSSVCGELPEVESCSTDGYCNMAFANAVDGARIDVTTYGPYERWNTPGEEASVAVQAWKVSSIGAVESAPACPSGDFDAFLQDFAADEKIERAFTAPFVKVAELGGGEDGDDAVLVYEAGAKYDGFNVVYSERAFHFVDGAGAKDASPLTLSTEAQGDDVRIVRYRYGMSEGNSYRFERKDGCWYLTQDPEPPSP
jgi:hypothetical protein